MIKTRIFERFYQLREKQKLKNSNRLFFDKLVFIDGFNFKVQLKPLLKTVLVSFQKSKVNEQTETTVAYVAYMEEILIFKHEHDWKRLKA
jgi:hypothetical protein